MQRNNHPFMKPIYFLLILTTLFYSCSEPGEKHEKDTVSKHHHDAPHADSKHHGHHHSANEYMHQESVDELIKRFESPERDAYQQPEKVLEYLGDISGKKIMDIGAGSGYFSVKLAEKGAQVIAADVSEEFQSALKKRIEQESLSNISLRKIPFESPNLAPNEVDMVLIVNTYHHIEDRPGYFAQVKKGTKESGKLVVIDFFKSETPVGPPVHHKIGIDQVISELKEAGYDTFEVNVDLLPYQYIIMAK
jgi:ubiquinone/menaquinone biosynthesis C-methylase UbiE